jgi:hypothetical protein
LDIWLRVKNYGRLVSHFKLIKMRKFYILLLSSLLISSCNNIPPQVTDITTIIKDLSIRKEMAKENNKSYLAITFLKNTDNITLAVTPTSTLSYTEQKERVLENNGFTFHGIAVPNEILLQVFSELSVKDIASASQVCKGWYGLSQDPSLWRAVRLHIHGDYPASQASKEQAKLHLLRVYVNTLSELTTMEQLIAKYHLNKGRPFVRYQALTYKLIQKRTREIRDEQAAQGNQEAIGTKIIGLEEGEYGYEKDPEAAVCLNEYWVSQGNGKAIKRKVKGIDKGFYGYAKDRQAAQAYLEELVAQGNEKAIGIKLWALVHRWYGYDRDLAATFSLNEYWVNQGSIKAMEREVDGLVYGKYGYKRNKKAGIALNEKLIVQGNGKAIRKKIKGLRYSYCGYKQDLEAALEFTEQLIEQGNEEGVIRKVKDLSKDKDEEEEVYGNDEPLYQPDLGQLKSWLEEEASKGKRWACYLKAKGLKYGILGYEKDMQAAIEYIKKHSIPY